MHLTEEQQAVMHSPASCLRVNALAGTGKTATLVAYAGARPSERLLYVAFNKAVQREAQNRFPPNVECRTAHSLAFRACGQPYQHKLGPDPKARDVVVALDLERCFEGDRTVAYLFAMDVLATLKRWLNSSWAELDKRALHHSAALERLAPTVSSGALIDVAQQLWRAMCDRENTAMPMPHDGYLKRYQLRKPTLAYDIVLFDEAQDANPAMTCPVSTILSGRRQLSWPVTGRCSLCSVSPLRVSLVRRWPGPTAGGGVSGVVVAASGGCRRSRQLPRAHEGGGDAAVVVLATAHKAKGLEFPQVQLAEDFAPLCRDEGRALRPPVEVPPEEINLLYVAATRARAVLTPNADLRRLVGEGGPTRLGRFPPASNVTHVSYLCNNDTYETHG